MMKENKMKIVKSKIAHWNSAGTDSVIWKVLDANNKEIFWAYKKKQAVAFVAEKNS